MKERRTSTGLLIGEIRKLAGAGQTREQTAKTLNLSYSAVVRYGIDEEIEFRRKRKTGASERAQVMADMYRAGSTGEEIGRQFGLTRERIRQILTREFGITAVDGGARKTKEDRLRLRIATLNARSIEKYGCSRAQFKELRKLPKVVEAYNTQKGNARTREIPWELNLWQWWTIWQQSQRWEMRGRGQGYCMCRVGDAGPYAPGNVFIARSIENSANRRDVNKDLPIGVHPSKTPGKFVAHRMINGKTIRLGTHLTPEDAHAAYLAAREGGA